MKKELTMKTTSFFAFFAIIFLGGCGPSKYVASTYNTPIVTTRINSFGQCDFSGKTFYITSSNSAIDASDPEFKEYAGLFAKAIQIEGAVAATVESSADLAILMDYSISDQSYNYTEPVPIWGPNGVSGVNTSYSYNKKGNISSSNSFVTHSYGVTGYANVNRHKESYHRMINIYVYDNISPAHEILWKTNLVSIGDDPDFREIAPYMIFSLWKSHTLGESCQSQTYPVTRNNDYLFNMYNEGNFTNGNKSLFHHVNHGNSYIPGGNHGFIHCIEYLPNETKIVFECDDYTETGNNWFRRSNFTPFWTITANGQQYKVKSVEIDGSRIDEKKSVLLYKMHFYYILHFPAIPRNVSFDICEFEDRKCTKKGTTWNEISTR